MSGCKSCKEHSNELRILRGTNKLTRSSYIRALNTGYKWSTKSLTYYFVTTSDTSTVDDGGSESITNWTSTQKGNYRTALESWATVSELSFTEITLSSGYTSADIKLYLIDDFSYPYLGHAYFPTGSRKGQNYISLDNATDTDFTVGSYDYVTMVHEFGHTLGLAHSHDKGGSSTIFDGVTSSSSLGRNKQNQTMYTVMSYNDLNGPLTPNSIQSYGFIYGPMAYDISTIQKIYGKNVVNNGGNTTYTLPLTNSSGSYYLCIVDSGGTDTIDSSSATVGVTINLRKAKVNGKKEGWWFRKQSE